MEKNLTTGSVFKNVIIFSLPYVLSYFLQTLYGMADLFIVGQFNGVESTTAVSIGSQVMHMLTVMIVGLAMGTTVSIAKAVGAKEHEKVHQSTGNTISLFLIVAFVLMIVLVMGVNPIVHWMSTPQAAVDGTTKYLIICFIGIPFITAYNIISSIFRGMGDSQSPMYFIGVACLANIVLDYVFIGGLHLGAVGAALGTTFSQAVSVLISLIVIVKKQLITLHKEDFKLRSSVMKNILSVGTPIAFQDGLIQVSFILITIIANQRGLNDAAAVGIVEKIMSFLFLIPSSMLSTVSALGAQNIGAHKMDRAIQTLRYAIMISVGFECIVSVFMQFRAEDVVALFTNRQTMQGQEVVRLGGQYLKGYVWDSVFAGIHFSFSGYFCAFGKSIYSFIHNIIAIVLVRVPGAYLASTLYATTLFPMGLATAAGSLLSVCICSILFVRLQRGMLHGE